MKMAVNVVSIVYEDSEGKRSAVAHYLPATINTVALAKTETDGLIADLDAVSDCEIVEANVTFNVALPAGIKSSPVAGSRNDAGATLSFRNSADRAMSVYVPGFKTSKIAGGVVQIGDSDVTALAAQFTLTGAWTDENELALAAYRAGKQSTRKNA
jgi:hypothetical protein